MDSLTSRFFYGFLFVLGLVLIAGGIATGKEGASIIGLIVAAVNIRQYQGLKNSA